MDRELLIGGATEIDALEERWEDGTFSFNSHCWMNIH
jgi:hypothetical protein